MSSLHIVIVLYFRVLSHTHTQSTRTYTHINTHTYLRPRHNIFLLALGELHSKPRINGEKKTKWGMGKGAIHQVCKTLLTRVSEHTFTRKYGRTYFDVFNEEHETTTRGNTTHVIFCAFLLCVCCNVMHFT